jgi:hypothetical protein
MTSEVFPMPKDGTPFSVELETEKIEFLQKMAQQFGLPDAGKAIRCLINYARENPERHSEIFDEVRCLDC